LAARPADGCFVYHPFISSAEIAAQVAEYHSLGFTHLALAELRSKSVSCSSNSYAWTTGMPSNLSTWLSEAALRGMNCYLGLVFSTGACATWGSDATNRSQDAADLDTTVATIVANHGTSRALAGWYIVNEATVNFDHSDWAGIKTYYSTMVSTIRARSNLPILIAPYISSNGTHTLAQTAAQARELIDLGINYLVVQDAVGAGGISVWSRTPDVEDYFDAMATSIGTALWADNEVYGYPAGSFAGTNYTAGSMVRLDKQLDQSRAARRHLLWLPNTQMGSVDDNRRDEAPSLLAAYKAWFGLDGEYIKPASYTWTTAPVQADTGNTKMFDLSTGDPLDGHHTDAQWVGFGTGVLAECNIDLGVRKRVAWVRCHTLNRTASSIKHPASIEVLYSIDGSTYSSAGTWTHGYDEADGEFMVGNTTAIDVTARYLKVRLTNAAKTYISEIEVIGLGRAGISTRTPGFSDLVNEHVR
jgi:hypothetical protein